MKTTLSLKRVIHSHTHSRSDLSALTLHSHSDFTAPSSQL